MKRKRIAIVENDPDMRFILGRALNNAGYAVETCQSPSGIIEGKEQPPDLVILGKNYSTTDTLTDCKHLKIHERTKQIPVIMISEYPVKSRAKNAGADEFITKPFQLNYLLTTIHKYFLQ